jgi:SAM-dependent methyltransferase
MQLIEQKVMRAIEGLPGIGSLYRKIERRLFFRHAKRLRMGAGLRLGQATNNTVDRGIFVGMKIHPETSWGVDQFTILSGQYECELYDIIASVAAKKYRAFLDIGCANGFYAVGFAMISTESHVIAYDIDEKARRTTALNAELNGVSDRISIRSFADHSELAETIPRYPSVFVLADIEGGELDLMDPSKCPALIGCDLLIEVHGRTEEVAEILIKRFSRTHRPTVVSRQPRNPFQYGDLGCSFEDEAWIVVSEGRRIAQNNWLLLERD